MPIKITGPGASHHRLDPGGGQPMIGTWIWHTCYLELNCASLWYTPCILNMPGAGFATNLQIWFLGTTPFDTTPFICLWQSPKGSWFGSKLKRYRTDRNRNVYVTRNSVRYGFWALNIKAVSKPKYRTVSKSHRSDRDLPLSGLRRIHNTAIFHTKNCQTKHLWVKIPKSLR